MRKLALTLIVAALSLAAVGQTASTAAPAPAPAQQQPALTEVETLRVENLRLKAAQLQERFSELKAQYAAVIKQIEDAHPGWKWDDASGRLVLAPAPPAKEKK